MSKKTDTKVSTAVIVLLLVPVILLIFLATAYYWSNTARNLPKLQSSDKNTALRGKIVTADGYSISDSQKLYKVMVDSRSIDKNKLDLFVKLYSIYTNDNEKRVKRAIQKAKNTVVLSYKIDAKTAVHLKELARKLNNKKVFISFEGAHNKSNPPIGMSILESGERREFIARDGVTPVIGYVKKVEVDDMTKIAGVKGIEKYYDYYLSPIEDELIKGPRDLGNNIILEKSAQISSRSDGYNAHMSIPLKLQKKIESLIDQKAEDYDAKEIIIGIINSKTGQILSLATNQRYNPEHITKKDYQNLNSTATEYAYEAGSVIKPLIFSLIYEDGKINLNEKINTHNGSYKLGRRVIKDTHKAAQMNPQEIIIHSSNIGMIMLSSRLDGQKIYQGLMNFGLSQKTGIDLPYEQTGKIPSARELNSETYKATTSYGYGLQATFIQILNAYTTFNNNGVIISPRIVSILYLPKNNKFYKVNEAEKRQVVSKKTADAIKDILIRTVQEGTGRGAQTPGLDVGGKTGTARIAFEGGYSNKYNSSFFGFANDQNTSLTIGVLVREPKKGSYYASQNALYIFKNIIDILVEDGYLTPNPVKKAVETKLIKDEVLETIKD